MYQKTTIWCQPADGRQKGYTKKCLKFEKNAISHMTFVGQPTLSARAYHTCTASFTCVFATPYLLNNLILTLYNCCSL